MSDEYLCQLVSLLQNRAASNTDPSALSASSEARFTIAVKDSTGRVYQREFGAGRHSSATNSDADSTLAAGQNSCLSDLGTMSAVTSPGPKSVASDANDSSEQLSPCLSQKPPASTAGEQEEEELEPMLSQRPDLGDDADDTVGQISFTKRLPATPKIRQQVIHL